MLQEEQQQLRAVLLGLGDTLKALNVRLDADAGRLQKSLADQKLIVEGVAETTRILREKADETNVRLSSMTQELQSLRQTVSSMPPPVPSVALVAERRATNGRPGGRGAGCDGSRRALLRRQTFRRRRCGIGSTRSTRPGSSIWPSRDSSRSSGRFRRRRRPTTRSCTSAIRSSAPASTLRR